MGRLLRGVTGVGAVALLLACLAGAGAPAVQFLPPLVWNSHYGTVYDDLAIADVTGDGRLDVVTTNGWEPALVAQLNVFAQQPEGSLALPATTGLPESRAANFADLATGDFDGDGKSDAAVGTRDGVLL